MISASLIISSFTSFSFSFFKTLMATSTWRLTRVKIFPFNHWHFHGSLVQCGRLMANKNVINKRVYFSVWRTPFLTQPKFPEPSSTSSIISWLLWIVNFLTSFGSWYGLSESSTSGSVDTAGLASATTDDMQQEMRLSNVMCMSCVCLRNLDFSVTSSRIFADWEHLNTHP